VPQSPLTCEGCYHAIRLNYGSSANSGADGPSVACRECELCIRNPSVFSDRTLQKEVIIDGVAFTAPLDLYITHDRKRFDDFLLMKKIQEILETQKKTPIIPDIYPQPHPYPNYPNNYWRTRWTYTCSKTSIDTGDSKE
jgi:hypothetical protein